ncbi:MAG: hypothetical protein ACOCP6_01740 [Desulfosalsimonas sp.]
MKIRVFFVLSVLVAVLFAVYSMFNPAGSFASEHDIEKTRKELEQKVQELEDDADILYEDGSLEELKEVVELYEEVLEEDPDSFEANWRIARACRFYADLAKMQEADDWEDKCRRYGEKGMEYAKKAIELKPERPEGYYYYGLCVGSYSDGVGIITALRKGLKGKTQENLEKAYEIDKNFAEGGPIVALGRFWQLVPWPYNDTDKAMQYYREFQETESFDNPRAANARVWMSEILIDRGGSKAEEEARELLEETVELTDNPYWEKEARELLEEI